MHNLNRFLSVVDDASKNTKGVPNKSKGSSNSSVDPSSRFNGGVNFVLADIDTATSLVRPMHLFLSSYMLYTHLLHYPHFSLGPIHSYLHVRLGIPSPTAEEYR